MRLDPGEYHTISSPSCPPVSGGEIKFNKIQSNVDREKADITNITVVRVSTLVVVACFYGTCVLLFLFFFFFQYIFSVQ